jgi:Protein of unknown function (DUF2511)
LLRPATAAALIGLLGCAACGSASVTEDHPRRLGEHARLVSQAEYQDVWPFGPKEGVVRCRAQDSTRIVTFQAHGVTYALNGTARRRGFAKIQPILLTDHAGLPYDYSPVLRVGLTLCGR